MRVRHSLLLVAALAAGACNTNKAELEQALQEAEALNVEKDKLLAEVLETTKFVNEIDSELARAKGVGVAPVEGSEAAPTDAGQQRQVLLGKVREVVSRLDQAEQNLEQSKARAQAMGSRNQKLLAQIEEYQTTITGFRETLARQETEIVALRAEVDTVRGENVRLATEKAALTDTVVEMTTAVNTAYYLVGTKEELIQKGVVTEEGGSRVLFIFGKAGKTLVPARTLDPSQFTRIDRLQDSTIELPRTDRGYRVVTPQSTQYVQATKLESGRLADSFHILTPEEFWKPSRYLILVEEKRD
jgi:predicted  nucleic acid-binding Zn-ribbon protein